MNPDLVNVDRYVVNLDLVNVDRCFVKFFPVMCCALRRTRVSEYSIRPGPIDLVKQPELFD